MKISHIKISNILGIDELDFSPDGFTEISGPNGTGKTSVLEAIKATLKGGHDATLLRAGAEKGEIVLVLDDGTEIKKKVGQNTSSTDISRGGKKVTRPGEFMQAITDLLSVNPVDFLLAPKKDRVRVLLEAMPIEVDIKKLSELARVEVKAMPGLHALHVIQTVHTQVYDERTGTNRAIKEKKGTISQLQAAIPPVPTGVDGDEADLQALIDEAGEALEAEKTRITNKLAGLRTKLDAELEELRTQAQTKKDAFAEIEKKANTQRELVTKKHTDTVGPLKSQLSIIRNDREANGRRQQTLDTISTMETEVETLTADAAEQTQALEDIESYKSELLASLPIPGVEVIDGEIYADGVPFDRLNTARQTNIAVDIAKLRAGDLGVVCVDRIEQLDGASYDTFREQALASGLQMFVTRVGNEGFAITSSD